MLGPGDPAPDFDRPGSDGGPVGVYRLTAALADGPALLVFYPWDFHPRTTAALGALRDLDDAGFRWPVFAIGPDSAYSHRAYAERHSFGFPLLSDPDCRVADRYGVPVDAVDHHPGVPRWAAVAVGRDATVRDTWLAAEVDTDVHFGAVARSLAGTGE